MSESSSDQDIVKNLVYEMVEGYRTANVQKLHEILSEEFILTDPNGPSFTKTEFIAKLIAKEVTFTALTVDEVDVRINDDVASVMGKATAHGRSKEGGYNGQYSFTDIFMKRQGRWRNILSAVSLEKIRT